MLHLWNMKKEERKGLLEELNREVSSLGVRMIDSIKVNHEKIVLRDYFLDIQLNMNTVSMR